MSAIASIRYSDNDLSEIVQWLRNEASGRLNELPGVVTLQTTALMHEAFLKLLRGQTFQRCSDRAYRIAAASAAVREAFANAVRMRCAEKRGARWTRVNLLEDLPDSRGEADFSDLHEAVQCLSTRRPRAATVVDLKFYAGLSIAEIAELLDVSDSTIEADWRYARKFIHRALS